MKNLKLGLMLCMSMVFGMISAQTYDVTFSVDMSGYSESFTTPTVNGSFGGWCGNCSPLTNTTGTIWETTLTLEQGVYDYKFAHDDWTGEEVLFGLSGCTINTDGVNFANRQIDVQADTVLPTVCWEECLDCGSAANAGCTDSTAQNYDSTAVTDDGSCEYLLTVTVDMSQQTSSGPVNSVFGSFNGWCPGCTPLTDNGDGTWSTTLTLANGAYEYKFHNDGVGALGEEQFVGGESCTLTTGAFTNRFVDLTSDTVIDVVCWQSCDECVEGSVPGCTDADAQNFNDAATEDDGSCQYLLSVTVDMSEVTDPFTTPEINGNYNGWCGGCNPLVDNGDGTWSGTFTVPSGQIEYKFAADGWSIQEDLTGITGCVVDFGGNWNRVVQISGDTTVDEVCWGSCSTCEAAASSGCTDSTAQNYNSDATEDDGSCEYLLTLTVDLSTQGAIGPVNSVFGAFNGWTPGANVLTDNGDGTWSTTVTVLNGNVEYKFHNDGVGALGEEIFVGGESCTLTTGAFTNRVVNVTADTTVPAVCWESCDVCADGGGVGCTDATAQNYDSDATADDGSCQYLLTLTVDLSTQGAIGPVNSVFGAFNGWTPGVNVLTDNGDGTWSTTVTVTNGDNEYKFHNDGEGALGEETFAGGESCTITTGAFTNRIVNVTGDTTVPAVCWESCLDCDAASTSGCTDSEAQNFDSEATADDGSCQYLLTVTVDMSEVTSAFTQPTVNGTFNGWCGTCNPLTDNGDGTWTTTLTVLNGGVEYKFAADDWSIQEEFVGGESCTLTTGAFTNRFVEVTGNTTIDVVCWEACVDCESAGGLGCTDSFAQNFDADASIDNGLCEYLLTVTVDMSEVTADFTQPTVNGTFNGWCGDCNPLTDNGDGTWTTTLVVQNGQVEYKFAADNWAIQEELAGVTGCTLETDGFTNRVIDVSGDTTVDLVCWESCTSCGIMGCTDPDFVEFNPDAVIDDGSCLTLTVFGCAYAEADNFNPQANTDDGSCEFSLGAACPGDFNEDGAITASDLTAFLSVFGLTCD